MQPLPAGIRATVVRDHTGVCVHCEHTGKSHHDGRCNERAGWWKGWRRCPCPGFELVKGTE
ncbi:MAG TPA: hypothetical protein VKV06_04245 [Acidimicrobiales bacterium]|nr:hypothetical protein [Acidimicrobiales bacterium]